VRLFVGDQDVVDGTGLSADGIDVPLDDLAWLVVVRPARVR